MAVKHSFSFLFSPIMISSNPIGAIFFFFFVEHLLIRTDVSSILNTYSQPYLHIASASISRYIDAYSLLIAHLLV